MTERRKGWKFLRTLGVKLDEAIDEKVISFLGTPIQTSPLLRDVFYDSVKVGLPDKWTGPTPKSGCSSHLLQATR